MAQKEVLKLEKVRKAFGGLVAVNDVDLIVESGEVRAIIGPNGAGKTTLFNLITGHLSLDGGRIFLHGKELRGQSPHQACQCGIGRTFQISSLFTRMTVLENIQVGIFSQQRKTMNLFSSARRMVLAEAWDILESVGLTEQAEKIGGVLSHGDRKLLELGIALASKPALLLLDEPTAGMAAQERLQMMAKVKQIGKDRNITLFFTEHDMDVVFSMAEKVTVMHQGKVIAEGDPDHIRSNTEVQEVYLGWQK